MKKLLLASAISMLAANSAQAVTIYEDEKMSFDIKGDWQIQLRDDHKNTTDMDVEYDDLELKNSIVYKLNENLKAFGQLDFGFKDAAEGKQSGDDLEEAYIGLQFNNVKVAIGKMDLAGDEFGIEKAYEQGLDGDQFDAVTTSGDDVIRLDADLENYRLAISHELESDGNDSADGEATDVFLGAGFGALSLAAAWQNYQANGSTYDDETWGLSAEYDADFVTVGVDHSSTDFGNPASPDADLTNLAATFSVAKNTKISVGYIMVDSSAANADKDEWYLNATYKFASQKNVSVFAEVGEVDDEANAAKYDDMNMLVGMRIKF